MSFPSDVALNGDTYSGTTEGSVTYSEVQMSPDGSLRSDPATATSAPKTLKVAHQQSTKNGIRRYRRVVRLDQEFADADEGLVGASVYLVVDHPIGTDVTSDNIKALIGRLVAFTQASGYLTKLLNGEP